MLTKKIFDQFFFDANFEVGFSRKNFDIEY